MHYAPGSGFLDKPENKAECKIMQDVRIFCKSPSAREAVLSRLEKVSKAIEEGCDGVYTYHSFSSLDDDKEVRIFSRFKDKNTMESHLRQSEILNFWSESKNDIARMDHRAFFPNGKGWLHR
jgi:quinol monooxygenase YgiN